jgi:hypothetical protein
MDINQLDQWNGTVLLSYQPVGFDGVTVFVTNANFLSPSGFHLSQSERIVHGQHWEHMR